MASNTRISIYDTTLRDGNQALGISLSVIDKLRIAKRIDQLGVDFIEGGWPTPGNTVDREFFKQAQNESYRDKIVVFGATRRKGVTCGKDPLMQLLVKSGTRRATIFGKSWDLHVKKVISATLSENLDMISETVVYLKKHFDEVIYDAEHFFDGYRANSTYALKTIEAAARAGADCVVLCDTNGGLMSDELEGVYTRAAEVLGTAPGVHFHNDGGCAVANSFLGVKLGSRHVQGTINGLGERCGNANLCTIIPGLVLKYGYRSVSDAQLITITETSKFVSEIANIAHDIRQPYVGEAAFSHKAGTHADGVRKTRESFEHVAPEKVGNDRRFVISDQAGASSLVERLSEFYPTMDKKDSRVKAVLTRILDLENQGYHFEAADGSVELIAREIIDSYREPFEVKGFRVIEEKLVDGRLVSEATILVEENGRVEHTAALGDGPVNSLDNAVRKALANFFPSLKSVKLEDFKVRVLDEKEGTAAKVRVLIQSSDGVSHWGTVGVSSNIIEASWIALVDSLKYKLMKDSLTAH